MTEKLAGPAIASLRTKFELQIRFLAKLIFMYLRPPLHVERASERQEISVPFAASLGPQITAFERYFIGNG